VKWGLDQPRDGNAYQTGIGLTVVSPPAYLIGNKSCQKIMSQQAGQKSKDMIITQKEQ
jgi:hypothetical protein